MSLSQQGQTPGATQTRSSPTTQDALARHIAKMLGESALKHLQHTNAPLSSAQIQTFSTEAGNQIADYVWNTVLRSSNNQGASGTPKAASTESQQASSAAR